MTYKEKLTSISTIKESFTETFYSGSPISIKEVSSWVANASFERNQTDLIAFNNENGKKIIFVDFFTNHELPSIETENGLLLKGSLLKALAGPLAVGQYAALGGDQTLSIGEVSSVTGTAKATRLDGNIFNLSSGDPVFQGDIIETEGSASVGLVFLDKTTMSLSDGGKMVLDELVYDPASGDASMAIDMLEGAFSFVSGEIAKTGPDAMSVSTPVATIGIRGTTVAGKAAVEGNENSFTLLQDAGGGVGQISVSNSAGTQTLSQVGATTSITSINAAPPPPVILSAAQIQANYGSALAVLPPTPVVAPQPQSPPPPQEQEQQQEQQQEEEVSDENTEESETFEEDNSEGEELVEGELGPDGEPLAEGELGPDGEPLAEGEGGPPIGPDGEPLAEGEGGPPIGPDGELLAEGEGGPPIGPDGGPPIGPDGAPLTQEQGEAANEAFETAMADGATPEEAMAAAAEAGGFDIPPGGFAGIPEEFRGDFGGSDSIALAEDLPGGPIGGAFAGDTFGGPGPGGEFGDGPFGGPGGGAFAGDTFGGPGPGGEFGDGPFGGDPGGRSFSGPGGDLISSNIGGNFGTQVIGSFGGFVGSGAGGEVAFSGPMGSGPVGVGIFGGPMGSGPTGGVGFGGPMGSGPAGGGGFGGPMGSGTAGGDGFGGPMGSGPAGGSFGFTGIYGPVAGVFAPAISDVGYSDTPYFYDDPALYDDYGTDSSISSQSIQTTDFSQSGDNNANTIDKSAESSSWTLSGFSGDDTLTGGSGSDVLFGGLGSDTLTGSGGDDQFYFTDYSDGIDTISDFGQSGDADTLLFGANPASSYTRKTMHADSGTNGSTYNISTDNTLPTIINFTADTSNYNSAANVATHLSGFKVTTDGTNAISTTESYFLLLGNGTNSSVYVWEDTGNGVIAQSELNHMANLTGIDNDTLSGVEFAFNTISGV